jgi:hypothetical protein
MKEKRLIAMLVSSIAVFVASLTVSLGVAFALADPVAAQKDSKSINFDPVGIFSGNVEEAIHVYSYDDVEFDDEAIAGQIKLVKVKITNDEATEAQYILRITVAGAKDENGNIDPAYKYTHFVAIDADTKEVYQLSNAQIVDNSKYADTYLLSIKSGETKQFIVASYISDDGRYEVINLDKYMTMTVSVMPM